MDANAADERMHPVRNEPAWSESYYFNFVDPDTKVAMFTRMGFRPGDGWADGLHAVYLGGDRVAFTYGRRTIERDLSQYDGNLAVGGLRIDCVEPFGLWRVAYSGPAQDIADAAILLERSKLRPEGWYRDAATRHVRRLPCAYRTSLRCIRIARPLRADGRGEGRDQHRRTCDAGSRLRCSRQIVGSTGLGCCGARATVRRLYETVRPGAVRQLVLDELRQ